jgi:hypothetical protein
MFQGLRLWAVTVVVLLGSAHLATAGIIHSLVGTPEFGVTPISGSLNISQAETYQGVLHLVGQSDGKAAAQQITLGSTPTAGDLRIYDSLFSQATPGLNPGGQIANVGIWNDDFYYLGRSRSPNAGNLLSESSIWNPVTGFVTGLGLLSTDFRDSYLSSAGGGNLYGADGGFASIIRSDGTIAHLTVTGPPDISNVNHASSDGRVLVGAYAGSFQYWRLTDPETFQYQAFSETSLETREGMSLGQGRMAFSDPILGEIGISEYFDGFEFLDGVGVWDLASGELLADYGPGSAFADAGIYEGELVLAINDSNGSYLSALSDGSRLTLAELLGDGLGYDSYDFAQGGLYQGSLGIVAVGQNGGQSELFTVAYNVNATTVPEPGSLVLLLIGAVSIVAIREWFVRGLFPGSQTSWYGIAVPRGLLKTPGARALGVLR